MLQGWDHLCLPSLVLRCVRRHPCRCGAYVAPAPVETYEASTSVVACIVPVPPVSYGASAPVNEDVAPAPAGTCAAPTHVMDDTVPAPAVTDAEHPMAIPRSDELLWLLYGQSGSSTSGSAPRAVLVEQTRQRIKLRQEFETAMAERTGTWRLSRQFFS